MLIHMYQFVIKRHISDHHHEALLVGRKKNKAEGSNRGTQTTVYSSDLPAGVLMQLRPVHERDWSLN